MTITITPQDFVVARVLHLACRSRTSYNAAVLAARKIFPIKGLQLGPSEVCLTDGFYERIARCPEDLALIVGHAMDDMWQSHRPIGEVVFDLRDDICERLRIKVANATTTNNPV